MTDRETAERIRWAVDQLPWQNGGHVMEIGCGGGHAVAMLCARRDIGFVSAIDRSAAQVRNAAELNHACIEAGRAAIQQCALEDAPAVLGTPACDTLLAINVNAFWTTPAPALAAAAQLLGPEGRAYLVFEPPSAAGLRRVERAMEAALAAHGWEQFAVRTTDLAGNACICVVASPRSARAPGERARSG